MSFRDLARSITPNFLLNWNRQRKKSQRNSVLNKQKDGGKMLSKEVIVENLKDIGIVDGDSVLVHSSLSRIGYLEHGPKTLVDALLSVVGEKGNILMPTSPNAVFQLDYIRNTPFFDILNSPSKTGAITEYFRTMNGVKRSLHPTEPVCAFGPKADYFLNEHFGQKTPYNRQSPFYKISESNGKILYIGVTLSMAGTNLHTLEDSVEFKFPIYYHLYLILCQHYILADLRQDELLSTRLYISVPAP